MEITYHLKKLLNLSRKAKKELKKYGILNDTFRLSDADLKEALDSLDETCGFLIKEAEFRYWIEVFVNRDRHNAHQLTGHRGGNLEF